MNYHAHILITLRKTDELGFTGNKVREWNKKTYLQNWRKQWALTCSQLLNNSGYIKEALEWKYGYLTLREQRKEAIKRNDKECANRLDHVAGKHLPIAVYQLKKRNSPSYVAQGYKEYLHYLEEEFKRRKQDLIDIKNSVNKIKEIKKNLQKEHHLNKEKIELDRDP